MLRLLWIKKVFVRLLTNVSGGDESSILCYMCYLRYVFVKFIVMIKAGFRN